MGRHIHQYPQHHTVPGLQTNFSIHLLKKLISAAADDSENGSRTISGRTAIDSQHITILWKKKWYICNSKQFFFTYLGNVACSLTSPCGLNAYTIRSMSKNQFRSANSSHLLCSCLNSLICLISPHQYHFSPLPSSNWKENQPMHTPKDGGREDAHAEIFCGNRKGAGRMLCWDVFVDYRSFRLACAIARSQPSKMLPRFLDM